jgi:hypothetical protein
MNRDSSVKPVTQIAAPVTRVVLYRHGIGYFERRQSVEGDAAIDLHFRAAEMNDVLKSLTTLDHGEGHIASISYESTKPLERQLDDIAITLPDKNAVTALLTQLKGAGVLLEAGSRKAEGSHRGSGERHAARGEALLRDALARPSRGRADGPGVRPRAHHLDLASGRGAANRTL